MAGVGQVEHQLQPLTVLAQTLFGFFAAFGFLLMQKGFELYLSYFPSITLVYGAFATVPIFLLWLYLSWAMVLLGALVVVTLPEFRHRN